MLRSRDIDDSKFTLSVTEEHQAKQVISELYKSSQVANSVWGDIYRNKFLRSVKNAPEQMTPNERKEFNPGFKKSVNKLAAFYEPIMSKPKDKASLEVNFSGQQNSESIVEEKQSEKDERNYHQLQRDQQ